MHTIDKGNLVEFVTGQHQTSENFLGVKEFTDIFEVENVTCE